MVQSRTIRDPLPVWAFKEWVRRGTRTHPMWLRDAAILAIGLRLMRRPGEFVYFRRRDFWIVDGPIMMLRLSRSKTDQTSTGKTLAMEITTNETCPGRIAWLHISSIYNPDVFVFQSESGTPLSASAVLSIIRRTAEWAGVKAHVSGHSMRIGGARLL